MASLFVRPKYGSVSWSGRTSKCGEILPLSVDSAKKKKGTTLDITIRKEEVVVVKRKRQVRFASGVFAKNAKKVVCVVMGYQMMQGNSWDRGEFPVLKADKTVVKVVKVI
jgi:hypothetical protein